MDTRALMYRVMAASRHLLACLAHPAPNCLFSPPTPLPLQVDLHGMSVLEARAAVLCVLSMLQQQFRDSGGVAHDVTFITGRGAGSEGGEPVVRREVAALLQRLHLRLPPEAPADNPGRIVIPRQVSRDACLRAMCWCGLV